MCGIKPGHSTKDFGSSRLCMKLQESSMQLHILTFRQDTIAKIFSFIRNNKADFQDGFCQRWHSKREKARAVVAASIT